MAPGPLNPLTVLQHCQVSPSPLPPAGKPRTLQLTFFDLVFWDVPPLQRLFFYDNADLLSAPEFLLHELPLFEKSLAAALHHFYPLAGKLVCGIPEAGAPEAEAEATRLGMMNPPGGHAQYVPWSQQSVGSPFGFSSSPQPWGCTPSRGYADRDAHDGFNPNVTFPRGHPTQRTPSPVFAGMQYPLMKLRT
ncbi:Malonyl-coenzyme A:anthocyanin 3-O-glucoside-6''-O-malonyltransferase [Triticum urartu]|uniref:Malonyl-coenzyme A:anthocyanin 3-O-glucoside-6''-O-malonyltransferase n=1 Tax=Triticum urartu TaxID=4572 RepID=M7ZDT4_TRIUA|nr:Malonyl-coenzyme A:anthocyanin 3-O-glucoside-6''-O-malonyltransferase [Triticum urartu]